MSGHSLVDDDDDVSDDSATASSQSSKRRRLNPEAHEVRHRDNRCTIKSDMLQESDGDLLLPDSFRRSPRAIRVNRHGEEKHQPGSLVRITVKNFVTYTKATFNCGPSLNMIIGPNGTGKSTLVCAICLGLGYKANVLGRAKDLGEFVKHGSREAEIEVELAAKEGKQANPIIHHTIKREGNKSSWKINGRQATHKEVMALVRSFSIQIDNLCQFLPQDRVVEFAQMTPIGLLESTQKAAAQEHMTAWHTELKLLGTERISMQVTHMNRANELETLEKRQAAQQVEVDRLRERRGLMTRLQALEMSRPGLQYRIEKEKWEEMKETKQQYQQEYQDLSEQVAPALREVEQKEAHVQQLREAVGEARNISERFEQETERKANAVEKKKDEIQECEIQHNSEVQSHNKRKPELARLESQIRNFRRQYDEEPVEFDGPTFNARTREKDQQLRELRQKAEGMKGQENELKLRAQAKKTDWEAAKHELSDLQSASGQQAAKLKRTSDDTARAWQWLQKNQHQFEDRIYGPPLIECAVKDPRYAAAVETLFQKGDMMCFTCTNRNDWNKFRDICQNQLRLKDIYSRRAAHPLSHWVSPMSKEQLADYGLDEFAIDLVQGPEPILSMLCDSVKLSRTGISLRECSDDQFERLKDSPIQTWIAGQSSYKVARRREYGPSAVSTMVSQVRSAQYWTGAGVDTEAQRLLHQRLKEIERDLAELEEERAPFEGELKELKTRKDTLEDDIVSRMSRTHTSYY
jgi:chromosome segregation ATPase